MITNFTDEDMKHNYNKKIARLIKKKTDQFFAGMKCKKCLNEIDPEKRWAGQWIMLCGDCWDIGDIYGVDVPQFFIDQLTAFQLLKKGNNFSLKGVDNE